MQNTVTVGDFWYSSWGYDQTNINFFEVVSVSASGKSATFREIGSRIVESDGHTDTVEPSTDEAGYWGTTSGKTFRRQLKEYDRNAGYVIEREPDIRLMARWTSFANMYPYDHKVGQTNPNHWH